MNRSENQVAVAVHFGVSRLALVPDVFPPANVIGAVILARCLGNALIAAGLATPDDVDYVGWELNDSKFRAFSSDAAAAVQVLTLELGTIGILPLCQIGVLRDDGWQCVYPSPSVSLKWLFDNEQRECAARDGSAKVAQLCARLRQLQHPSGTQPENPEP